MTESRPEILPLTSLRFVAALYVFLFHIDLIVPLANQNAVASHLIGNGAVGMSLFFILSGFVLGYRYEGKRIHFRPYAFARFARIYPVYFMAALVTAPWLFWHFEATTAGTTQKTFMYLYIVTANVFMLQAWVPQLFSYWNNGGSWSLSVEAFFYALFPAVMLLIGTLRFVGRRNLLFGAYTAASFAGASMLFFGGLGISVFYSVPIYRLGEFVVGVLVGVQFAQGHRLTHPSLIFIGSIVALIMYLSIGPDFGAVYVASNFAVVPLFALILFSAAGLPKGLLRSVMETPVLVYLGRTSYSFYSFQALILLWIGTYKELVWTYVPSLMNAWLLASVAGMALSMIASASHHLIEVWFRDYLLDWRRNRAAVPV